MYSLWNNSDGHLLSAYRFYLAASTAHLIFSVCFFFSIICGVAGFATSEHNGASIVLISYTK